MNRGGWLLGVALVAIGVLWLLQALDVIDVLRWVFIGPVLLISLGLWMLVAGWGERRSESRQQISGPQLDETTVLGDREISAGPTFAGGSVTAVLADLDIDLRHTEMVSSPATLTVTAVLGDVDLHVPPSWRVQTTGSALLSDIKMRRDAPPVGGTAPELVIRTTGLFGDVTVRS